jgi:hypothetical protein
MKRWPEIRSGRLFGLFEANSGVLHCETAIKTWISLAEKAGCAQLFNCPVTPSPIMRWRHGQHPGRRLFCLSPAYQRRHLGHKTAA